MTTTAERAAIVSMLATAYPTQPFPADSIELYVERLAGFPPHVLEAAARRWIDRESWLPRLAELRALCHAVLEEERVDRTAVTCARCDGIGSVRLPVIGAWGAWTRVAYACRSCPEGDAMARASCTSAGCMGGEGCGGAGHHRVPGLARLDRYRDQTERRLALTVPAAYVHRLDVNGAYWLWFALHAAREHAEQHGTLPTWWTERIESGTPFTGPGPETWDGGDYRESLAALTTRIGRPMPDGPAEEVELPF